MPNDSCSYDCSKRPMTVSPYPDISGIGVVIGYVATAAIVIAIITFSVLAVHEPIEDPFQKNNGVENGIQTREFRPNPVDTAFLGHSSRRQSRPRLKDACLKCVLAMSDLQILAGISILISGYIQLPCGLSAYHWQVLVYLAWFSSLTHLSCLTFLRNYLYNRPGERAWRLTAMALLLIMLLVAMIPTGYYDWPVVDDIDREGPTPSDYAICYLYPHEVLDDLSFASMILSALLLGLGFLVRVVKLHKYLSVDIAESARHSVSVCLRRRLSVVSNKLNLETSPKRLARKLIYRPLLATFLILRVGVDAWTSMTVEVWWLIASFAWGVLNLVETLVLSDGGNSDWTFGQVVPIVLLAAPLLSLFEYLYPDSNTAQHDGTASAATNLTQTQAQAQIQPMQIELPRSAEHADDLRDHPERDYYTQSPWVKDFILFIILDMVVSTIFIFILNGTESVKLVTWLIPSPLIWTWLPLTQFLGLLSFVLFSFLIEEFGLKDGHRLSSRVRQRKVKILRYSLILAHLYLELALYLPNFIVFIYFGAYIFMCLLLEVITVTSELDLH